MAALVRHLLTNDQPFPILPRQEEQYRPGPVQRLQATLRLWQRRRHEQRELAVLTPRDLRDIGATPSEVWHELRQPFWRSPLGR